MRSTLIMSILISVKSLRYSTSHTLTSSPHENKQLKIAFATMLAHEPDEDARGTQRVGFLDSWGVLAESIRTHMGHLHPDLIAIVTPKVQRSRATLIELGWTLYEGQLPDISLVRNDDLRNEVESSGCCGSAEFLKAEPLLWTHYDRVIMTDTDMLVHHSFEELFQLNKTLVWTQGTFVQEDCQAALLIYRPSLERHQEMMDIWHRGDFGPRGWEQSDIGYFYGGATISGLLPYMFLKLHPEEGEMVDPCRYNHNGAKTTGYKAGDNQEVPYCKDFHLQDTAFNHFVGGCPKPWHCEYSGPQVQACEYFTKQWFIVRERVAANLHRNVSSEPACAGEGQYRQLS